MATIWRFVDGKAGHERQTAGFINAIERIVDCQTYDVDARKIKKFAAYLSREIDLAPHERPDLLIGAGSACQSALLLSRRAYGGSAVYFMRPKFPTSWFDLCIIPRHDSPPIRDNIIRSEGVLNDCRPAATKDDSLGIILVGGPSKHHRWDDEQLLAQIKEIIGHASERAPALQYKLSTSRRTPAETARKLRTLTEVDFISPEDAAADWLSQNLARATEAWVTADSISMMYEALSSGARLGVLATPIKRDDRIAGVATDLIRRGFAIDFGQWQSNQRLLRSPTLQEADRVAQIVKERFALASGTKP